MYFKQIELNGFKSFADYTCIPFEPGITAVVGPNGCGKSNILDALRWALGEQSAKTLRGGSMQDVIFNGTERRPPLGMAEVTLTFDNSQGRLPIDFTDVRVTRRVYRSGESEYEINGAPCRLRDIQELFMDTGIGTDAYSLIGQGKIDMILSSHPEDRRFLLEEAAGIIKYKTRKRIAMRKLESAQQNLTRLADIIGEVERQMRSLKRQVNAALRHRELTQNLRTLEIRNAWLRYSEISQQLEDIRAEHARQAETATHAEAAVSENEVRLQSLHAQREELERRLTALREQAHTAEKDMAQCENEIRLLLQERGFQAQRREELSVEIQELETQHSQIQAKQESLRSEIAAAIEAQQSAQQTADQAQQAHQETQSALEKVAQELEALRAQSLEAITRRGKIQTELETLSITLANLETQQSVLQKQQEEEERKLQELQQLLETAQQGLAAAEQHLAELAAARNKARAQVLAAQEEYRTCRDAWQNLREQKSRIEARLTSLRELRDSYEGYAAGVRAIMRARTQQPGWEAILGPVGDLFSTTREYERAIEAALGASINHIVTESAEYARQAVEFLKKNAAGKVTFLPLDTLRPRYNDDTDSVLTHAGVVGKAKDYVRYTPQLEPVAVYLFHNTVIVRRLEDAIQIAHKNERYPKLVTIDGELVTPQGTITGGRLTHENRGMLGRTTEIEELERQLAEKDVHIAETEQSLSQLQERIQQITEQIHQIEQAEQAARQTRTQAEAALRHTEQQRMEAESRLKRLSAQAEDLAQRRTDYEQRHQAVMQHVHTMDYDDETLQRAILEAQEQTAALREKLKLLSENLTTAKVRLAEKEQALQRLRIESEHLAEEEERIIQAIRLRRHQKDALSTENDTFEQQMQQLRARLITLGTARENASAAAQTLSAELERTVQEIHTREQELRTLRAQAQEYTKRLHALQLDIAHREEQITYLRERIAQEYNVALEQLDEADIGTDALSEDEREKQIHEIRRELQRLGPVNLMAIEEYENLEKRHAFLVSQERDLRDAIDTLTRITAEIDETIRAMFLDTFRKVADNFREYFRRLFNGGKARLYLLDENDPLESGIEIEAWPPGKKPQNLSLLSGGEQALTAIALLFAIFRAKPSPFCVLDEVDAPLDDSNIQRFLNILDEFTDQSQFIIITHNRITMEHADAIFGVTQQERGVSQIVSVALREYEPDAAATA